MKNRDQLINLSYMRCLRWVSLFFFFFSLFCKESFHPVPLLGNKTMHDENLRCRPPRPSPGRVSELLDQIDDKVRSSIWPPVSRPHPSGPETKGIVACFPE